MPQSVPCGPVSSGYFSLDGYKRRSIFRWSPPGKRLTNALMNVLTCFQVQRNPTAYEKETRWVTGPPNLYFLSTCALTVTKLKTLDALFSSVDSGTPSLKDEFGEISIKIWLRFFLVLLAVTFLLFELRGTLRRPMVI